MPVELNSLTEGWLELESDPGLFTLLLEDFGVRGVQVEEIYDLQKPIEGPVYGFIFLFKWNEERRSRRKVFASEESFVQDEKIVNSIFFAHQIVPNSCATHALLSVLLNCNKINLGETLTRLKEYTKNMSPENKGYAIGNTPELAKAHNSHAKPEPRRLQEKSHGFPTGRTMEAFHFVSFVPINGQLFELDGLKQYPNNHGPYGEHEDWTEKFRRVIMDRLEISSGGSIDIRFNLMAVVPDRRMGYELKLKTLKTNRHIVLEALQQLVKMTHPELTSDDRAEYMAAVIRSKQQAKQESTTVDVESSATSQSKDSEVSKQSPPLKNETCPPHHIVTVSQYGSHPALDNHNYAKCPLMEGQTTEDPSRPRYEDYSGSDYTSDEENKTSLKGPAVFGPDPTKPIHVNTKDYSHPLSIQTKFEASPTPSNSSTDTSSEVGSAFNSPVRTVGVSSVSPIFSQGRDIKKLLVVRMTSGKSPPSSVHSSSQESPVSNPVQTDVEPNFSSACATGSVDMVTADINLKRSVNSLKEANDIPEPEVKRVSLPRGIKEGPVGSPSACASGSSIVLAVKPGGSPGNSDEKKNSKMFSKTDEFKKETSKYPNLVEPHSFAPKDLLALLKNVENEITICESNLRDEKDKRKKYKVDDCRRTHNYDRFVCTFLSMLAQQEKLAELVQQHVLVKRRQGINVGRLHKKTDRRRRPRPKKKK